MTLLHTSLYLLTFMTLSSTDFQASGMVNGEWPLCIGFCHMPIMRRSEKLVRS